MIIDTKTHHYKWLDVAGLSESDQKDMGLNEATRLLLAPEQ